MVDSTITEQTTDAPRLQHYHFGPFTFEPDTGTLRHRDGAELLDPKIAQLLLLFVQQPGKLFSREQLLDEVWQGTIVNDNSVSWAISQLRKALQDEATESHKAVEKRLQTAGRDEERMKR